MKSGISRAGLSRRAMPAMLAALGMALSTIAVAPAARAATAATVPSGTVYGFGDNSTGQLGDGTTNSRSTPAPVSGLGPVSAIATIGGQPNGGAPSYLDTEGHSLAIKTDGTVWAWGSNRNGELGTGLRSNSPMLMPQPVALPSAVANPYIALAAGGWDDFNTLGGGDSMALRADGTVWVWGDNTCGRLGDGTNTNRATPRQVVDPADPTKPFGHVTAIAAGNGHSLALRDDGSVWAWGDGTHGELGDGNANNFSGPPVANDPTADPQKQALDIARWGFFGPYSGCSMHAVPAQVKLAGKKAIAIAAGGHGSLAILEDRSLDEWGAFPGDRYTAGSLAGSPLPVPVPGLAGRTFTSIASGITHELALATDGTVWAWGSNTFGELGNGLPGGSPFYKSDLADTCRALLGCGVETARMYSIFPPHQVVDPSDLNKPLAGVTAIAAGAGPGGSHSLALRADGTLLGWGGNGKGQIGQAAPREGTPVPVQVPGLQVGAIAAGGEHSLALVSGLVPAAGPSFHGLASALYLQAPTTLFATPGPSVPSARILGFDVGGQNASQYVGPQPLPDGGLGGCESKVDSSGAPGVTRTTTGLPACNSGAPPLLMVATNTVTTSGNALNGSSTAHSNLASLTLLPGMAPDGKDVLKVSGLDAISSVSCANGAVGAPSSYSSIAKTNLVVSGTTVETKPVGDKIYFNPTGSNQKVLYGNPIWVNPLGGKIPTAIVTLNYSSYDPATNTQVSAPIAVEFPAGGPLSTVIVGKVLLSYTQAGLQGCHA